MSYLTGGGHKDGGPRRGGGRPGGDVGDPLGLGLSLGLGQNLLGHHHQLACLCPHQNHACKEEQSVQCKGCSLYHTSHCYFKTTTGWSHVNVTWHAVNGGLL